MHNLKDLEHTVSVRYSGRYQVSGKKRLKRNSEFRPSSGLHLSATDVIFIVKLLRMVTRKEALILCLPRIASLPEEGSSPRKFTNWPFLHGLFSVLLCKTYLSTYLRWRFSELQTVAQLKGIYIRYLLNQ